jgi:mRNA interferase MazF
LCFQLRSLDPGRFPKAPAGRASEAVMRRIEDAVRHCLAL